MFSGWKFNQHRTGEIKLTLQHCRLLIDSEMADDLGWRDLASQRPDIVEKLQDLLAASPVGASTSIPLWKVILDPDEFGGAERKAPMADLALE